jgi:hypothetical protein
MTFLTLLWCNLTPHPFVIDKYQTKQSKLLLSSISANASSSLTVLRVLPLVAGNTHRMLKHDIFCHAGHKMFKEKRVHPLVLSAL